MVMLGVHFWHRLYFALRKTIYPSGAASAPHLRPQAALGVCKHTGACLTCSYGTDTA